MDKKDEEMREVIVRLWPVQSKKLIDLLVPPKEGNVSKNPKSSFSVIYAYATLPTCTATVTSLQMYNTI